MPYGKLDIRALPQYETEGPALSAECLQSTIVSKPQTAPMTAEV
jgi:hypothetical protein